MDELVKIIGADKVKRDEPMALHTTFKIGGPADLYAEAESTDDVVNWIKAAIELDIPYFVFGGGSNLLVADKGIRGLVIKNKSKNIAIHDDLVEADAGIAINYLVQQTIKEGLAGFEVYMGLPGTVGGAVWNNSHFRQPNNEFVGNLVHSAKLLDRQGNIKEVDIDYFHFSYDYSTLHDTHETVLSVVFKLTPGNKDELREIAAKTSVQKRYEEQPLELPSSGCTFQNMSKQDAERLGTPNLTQSAGYLIDQAGLKGKQIGQAKISEKHANFIVNLGGASATDIKELYELARKTVKEKFDVDLKEEIVPVGDW